MIASIGVYGTANTNTDDTDIDINSIGSTHNDKQYYYHTFSFESEKVSKVKKKHTFPHMSNQRKPTR